MECKGDGAEPDGDSKTVDADDRFDEALYIRHFSSLLYVFRHAFPRDDFRGPALLLAFLEGRLDMRRGFVIFERLDFRGQYT